MKRRPRPRSGPGSPRLTVVAALAALVPLVVLACGAPRLQPLPPTATTAPSTSEPVAIDRGRLAFIRDGDVWLTDVATHAERQLTHSGDLVEPGWAASGAWLSVRQVPADTPRSRLLMFDLGAAAADPVVLTEDVIGSAAWSPAADRLAWVTSSGAVIADANGSNRRDLPDSTSVAWSSDGTWLAYARTDGSVWRLRANGSGATQIQPPVTGARVLLAGWSRDDRHVLAWINALGSASLAMDGLPLEALPVDGTAPVRLSNAMLPHRDLLSHASTSGLAATLGSGRTTWTHKGIGLGDLTRPLRSVSPEGTAELYPAWSPDSNWLAFTSGGAASGLSDNALLSRRIWLMRRDGSQRHRLPASIARDERPEWSTDGRDLLWARIDDHLEPSVLLGPIDGGQPPRVVADRLGAPSFSSKGVYGYVDWSQLYAWWQPRQAGPTR